MKLDHLTFTRYIAALTVVFFHYGTTVGATPTQNAFWGPVVTAGPIAVSYFFALSGFIMAVAYYGVKRPFSAPKYWLARLARIYPVYLVALLLVLAFALLKKENVDFTTIALNIVMLQAWFPPYAMTLNTPGWSLSVELFFYLLFPLLLLTVKKTSVTLLFWGAGLLWIATQIIQTLLVNLPTYTHPSALHNFIFYHPFMHFSTFMLGLAIGMYFCDGKLKSSNQIFNNLLLIISAAAVILALAYRELFSHWLGLPLHYENGLLVPLFLTVLVTLANHQGWLKRLFSLPIFVLLGEASYSLYILQRPLYGIYDRTLGEWLTQPDLHFYSFVILLTLTSIASFYWFETPLRRFINALYTLSGKARQL